MTGRAGRGDIQMRDGDRVYDPGSSGYWWAYNPLEWWAKAATGQDIYGCRVQAWIEDGGIRIQHGEDPEQSRWFSLDSLNMIGGSWNDPSPSELWFADIHAHLEATTGSGAT